LSIRYEREIDMKKHIVLSLMLIVTCVLLGQEKPVKNDPPKLIPLRVKEARIAAESNYVETFTDAFKDPNVLIGVFERPKRFPYDTTLSSGENLRDIGSEILYKFTALYCVKPIKGEFTEPIIFVYTFPYIYSSLSARPPIPEFYPPPGSKWVLALKKTSREYRIARFSEEIKEIEKYKFLNENTLFMPFRYGHGALCLKWPEKKKEPRYLVKVPESIVEELKAIQRVFPYTQKEKIDPNESASITKTSKALKSDVAKSIFEKVLADRSQKTQDTNSMPPLQKSN
jgi:hypothetical protein